jgi:hypothetical protein
LKGHRHQVTQNSEFMGSVALQSPFKDCIGTFGLYNSQVFRRPVDGKVNGYIKFLWPKDKRGDQPTNRRNPLISCTTPAVDIDNSTEMEEVAEESSMTLIDGSAATLRSGDGTVEFALDVLNFLNHPMVMKPSPVTFMPSQVFSNISTEVACIGTPKLLPYQYGYEAKMDDTDRRFWMFCE